MSSSRPRIAVLGRFAADTSVTRYAAVVNAHRLLEAVWVAGGEPVTLLPVKESNWQERLNGLSGVLMPGGSDINPTTYGAVPEAAVLDQVNDLQDEVDLALARFSLNAGIPYLGVCRGFQLTNVSLGGSLVQDMQVHHKHHVSSLRIDKYQTELGMTSPVLQTSCYHHQVIDRLADGVEVIATSVDGHIEAVRYPSSGWAFGVQWHPEDNFDKEPGQLEIMTSFIAAASEFGNYKP